MELWMAGIAIAGILLAAGSISLFFRWYLTRLVDRRIEGFQKDLISRQIDEVENMYRQMRGWRHDFRNHIQTMLILLQNGEMERLEDYMNSLNEDLTKVDQVLKTGNVMADAILNSKLSLAGARGIAVNAKAKVPSRMRISDVNLCAVLGNLLDNAIEACMRIEDPDKRFIRVYIGTMKQQLYISVTNSMGKKPEKTGGRFLSSKSGRDEMARFGFGLMRIDVIAEQNGGYVNRQNEEGVFATEVMLPL
nr:GHKL domain-containing protein [uncultured Eisenbergiella sp.]